MKIIWGYILVFVLAAVPFFEAFGVIPIAGIAGLPWIPVFIIGLFGNLLTVFLLIIFIEQFQNWRSKRKKVSESKDNKRSIRAEKLWKKYGLPGLALLGPFFVGSHVTTLVSMTLGSTKKKTLIWMSTSITLWSLAITMLFYYGVDFLGLKESGLTNFFK